MTTEAHRGRAGNSGKSALAPGRKQPDDPGGRPLAGTTAPTSARDLGDWLRAASLPVADHDGNADRPTSLSPIICFYTQL
jgi:hypothetical protein